MFTSTGYVYQLLLWKYYFRESTSEASMDRILISLKKENSPRASSAPALGLNTIIFKHVYWYMQQTQVSVYRTIGPLVLFFLAKNVATSIELVYIGSLVVFIIYHIFTTKYVLFAYAIQTRVTFTYRGTVSRKPYPFKN